MLTDKWGGKSAIEVGGGLPRPTRVAKCQCREHMQKMRLQKYGDYSILTAGNTFLGELALVLSAPEPSRLLLTNQ